MPSSRRSRAVRASPLNRFGMDDTRPSVMSSLNEMYIENPNPSNLPRRVNFTSDDRFACDAAPLDSVYSSRSSSNGPGLISSHRFGLNNVTSRPNIIDIRPTRDTPSMFNGPLSGTYDDDSFPSNGMFLDRRINGRYPATTAPGSVSFVKASTSEHGSHSFPVSVRHGLQILSTYTNGFFDATSDPKLGALKFALVGSIVYIVVKNGFDMSRLLMRLVVILVFWFMFHIWSKKTEVTPASIPVPSPVSSMFTGLPPRRTGMI